MTIHKVAENLNNHSGKKFSTLFADMSKDNKSNKGKIGQRIEILAGLRNTNALLDCPDGELKTFPVKNGLPKETLAITSLAHYLEDFLENRPFEESILFKKIQRILYVAIDKTDPNIGNWYYYSPLLIDILNKKYSYILDVLKEDYYNIENYINETVKNGNVLHTYSGKFMQIRTKDSKDKNGKYHPIYCKQYNRYISNKRFAVYFKKDFLKLILAIILS